MGLCKSRPWAIEQKDLEDKGYKFNEKGECIFDPTFKPILAEPQLKPLEKLSELLTIILSNPIQKGEQHPIQSVVKKPKKKSISEKRKIKKKKRGK